MHCSCSNRIWKSAQTKRSTRIQTIRMAMQALGSVRQKELIQSKGRLNADWEKHPSQIVCTSSGLGEIQERGRSNWILIVSIPAILTLMRRRHLLKEYSPILRSSAIKD